MSEQSDFNWQKWVKFVAIFDVGVLENAITKYIEARGFHVEWSYLQSEPHDEYTCITSPTQLDPPEKIADVILELIPLYWSHTFYLEFKYHVPSEKQPYGAWSILYTMKDNELLRLTVRKQLTDVPPIDEVKWTEDYDLFYSNRNTLVTNITEEAKNNGLWIHWVKDKRNLFSCSYWKCIENGQPTIVKTAIQFVNDIRANVGNLEPKRKNSALFEYGGMHGTSGLKSDEKCETSNRTSTSFGGIPSTNFGTGCTFGSSTSGIGTSGTFDGSINFGTGCTCGSNTSGTSFGRENFGTGGSFGSSPSGTSFGRENFGSSGSFGSFGRENFGTATFGSSGTFGSSSTLPNWFCFKRPIEVKACFVFQRSIWSKKGEAVLFFSAN